MHLQESSMADGDASEYRQSKAYDQLSISNTGRTGDTGLDLVSLSREPASSSEQVRSSPSSSVSLPELELAQNSTSAREKVVPVSELMYSEDSQVSESRKSYSDISRSEDYPSVSEMMKMEGNRFPTKESEPDHFIRVQDLDDGNGQSPPGDMVPDSERSQLGRKRPATLDELPRSEGTAKDLEIPYTPPPQIVVPPRIDVRSIEYRIGYPGPRPIRSQETQVQLHVSPNPGFSVYRRSVDGKSGEFYGVDAVFGENTGVLFRYGREF